ncbi:MAG: galactitol-1-phosphate 5-dehydrogenase [Candidatus Bathyarchaeia archaeon]
MIAPTHTGMKAAVWHGGKDVRIEEVPDPEVKTGEVLVGVESAGICGSDAHAFEGKSKRRVPPLILGHEFSGVVADVGAGVLHFKNGDRVVVEPTISCGACESCIDGRTNICAEIKVMGLHVPGAFAEYVAVPARKCYKLAESVSFDEATLVEPLSVAIHAVNMTPTKVGDDLLVIGSGVIGLMILQVARLRVGGNVFVSDLFDYKLDLARRLGARAIIHSGEEDVIEKVRELTKGKGVDAVIEAVGIQDTLQKALNIVKKGGEITITGLLQQMIQVDIMKLVANEITMRGDYCYTSAEFETSLDLITKGVVRVEELITHSFPLGDIAKAVDVLTDRKQEPIKILVRP